VLPGFSIYTLTIEFILYFRTLKHLISCAHVLNHVWDDIKPDRSLRPYSTCDSRRALIISLLFVCSCCLSAQGGATTVRWQALLDSLQRSQNITGILVHVESPERNVSWTGASGVSDIVSGRPLTGNEPVRIASVTKSFVATAILCLSEKGKIALDDPVTKYISQAHTDILREGGYVPEWITIYHLLTHTSGLFDHGSSPEYMTRILDDPQYSWTRTEQLQGCMYWGRPVGKPGDRFSYSDTGYILLGEVLEKITGELLGIALRNLIQYDQIGLDETWFETTEPAPTDVLPRAHQYLDRVDTYDFNPALDLYGGGGIVTTMKDLTEFYLALFANKVYKRKSTLDKMLASVPKNYKEIDEMDYRMGIFFKKVLGQDAYTHSGFWGVQVWYLPALETAIAITVTRQEDRGVVPTVLDRIVGDMSK